MVRATRLAIIASAFTSICQAQSSIEQRSPDPTEIAASADEWIRVAPDRAVVDLMIDETSTSAAEAQKALEKKFARLDTALREKLGSPVKLTDRGTELAAANGSSPAITRQTPIHLVRYLAAETLHPDDAPQIVDTVLQNGATSVIDVNYVVRDREDAVARASIQAAKRAQRQAETIARALGVGLGPLIATAVAPDDEAALLTREKQDGMPAADFRDQEIKVTVTVRYQTAPLRDAK